jgi:hypothetical protein
VTGGFPPHGRATILGEFAGYAQRRPLEDSQGLGDHARMPGPGSRTRRACSVAIGAEMPSVYGAGATIIGGTPTQQGTFTITVDNVPFNSPGAPPSQGAYTITVNPPLPLKVVLPVGGSNLSPGTVGVAYAQNSFLSGGVAPYTWSVASWQLPPGLTLRSTAAPNDNNNQLAGTPPGRHLQVHDEGHPRQRPIGVTAVQAHHQRRWRSAVATRRLPRKPGACPGWPADGGGTRAAAPYCQHRGV